jgi:hypothetical protein
MKLLDAAISALTKNALVRARPRIGRWAQESRNVATIMTDLQTSRQLYRLPFRRDFTR